MPRRIRVVNAGDASIQQQNKTASTGQQTRKSVVVTENNPNVHLTIGLTDKEKRVRLNKRYAASTTLGMMRTAGDVIDSGSSQFYSPQLSTDFLEKPQNLRERRAFYRFFYNTNEIVRRALDIHSTMPLSKLRLVPPKGKNKHQNEYVFKFFEKMCEDMKLFKTLIEITHEYNLMGNCFMFCQEKDYKDGLSPEEIARKKEEAKQRSEFLREKYQIIDKDPLFQGWEKIIILPPDQVRVRKLPLTDEVAIDYVPDPETKRFLTSEVPLPDMERRDINYSIPKDLQEKVRQSGTIPLDTDPYTGSHVFHLARKKSQYEPLGVSIIESCVNTLVLLDKLRQAQTSIASRHMTPMRIVWAEDLNPEDVDNLREQVDMALVDPDFSIIANYEIHWEEMGSQGRLLDISGEYEGAMTRLLAGLEVSREILTGEGTWSGNRITLEIMNTQYLLYRELIQDYVENNLFKPVAKKKGFVEYDEYGNEILLYPRLSFTRLSIRDNEQFFDACFQLYQKGSVSIDLILDILNIDPESTREKIERDLFTVNDPVFVEAMRNIYTSIAAPIVEKTNAMEKIAKYLKLEMVQPTEQPEGVSRFSSDRKLKLAKVMKYLSENPEALDRIFEKKELSNKTEST